MVWDDIYIIYLVILGAFIFGIIVGYLWNKPSKRRKKKAIFLELLNGILDDEEKPDWNKIGKIYENELMQEK